MDDYFRAFEHRKPPAPIEHSPLRESLWQFLAVLNLAFGAWYLSWRWTSSLNFDALALSVTLVVAETCAYLGLILYTVNLWKTEDPPMRPAPKWFGDCVDDPEVPRRPIRIDVFYPTYDEDPELVRLSILDGKRIRYPHPIDLEIHVLDDGRRKAMRKVAEEEGVNYLSRDNNIGFKAGNMRFGLERTSGDFIVICDADTRVFPSVLENTMGYFRDPEVAWVQTPQWFFDLPEGETLEQWLRSRLGSLAGYLGAGIEKVLGPFRIGADPFSNDPQLFYDVIQRRRNAANASFCCGAGSIHRREAVMRVALRNFSEAVEKSGAEAVRKIEDPEMREVMRDGLLKVTSLETELSPFRFHVSEDIYTSIYLHSDTTQNWKSVLHPKIESKMLSPQDLQSWTVQRFKYAGGTLDIAIHDNPLLRPGLSWRQRLMYGMTFWSYLGVLWNLVFICYPILYLWTGVRPVTAYNADFFLHILPFLILNELAFMVGTWGVNSYKGKVTYLAFFPVNLRALWTVLRGQQIKFPTTPKDRQEGNFAHLVLPQIVVIALTLLGILFATTSHALGYGNYQSSGILANVFWGLNNVFAMARMVQSAFWKPKPAADPAPDVEPALKGA